MYVTWRAGARCGDVQDVLYAEGRQDALSGAVKSTTVTKWEQLPKAAVRFATINDNLIKNLPSGRKPMRRLSAHHYSLDKERIAETGNG